MCAFFHSQLWKPESSEILAYLHGRGAEQTVPFGYLVLGATPPQSATVRRKRCVKLGFTDDELVSAGNLCAGGKAAYTICSASAPSFRSLMRKGVCWASAGALSGDAKPKYLNTGDTPIFNKTARRFCSQSAQEAAWIETSHPNRRLYGRHRAGSGWGSRCMRYAWYGINA